MFQSFDLHGDAAAVASRVTRLRAQLATLGIDGLLIPRADAHQGEMVAARDERLAWISGFTGSAGHAVVLTDSAALFVDGRYTLQAAEQTDAAVFEVVAIHKTSVARWLAEATSAGQRIGYDPWLHGKAEIDRLAEHVPADLVPLEENPIDRVWEDQPAPPMGAVRIRDEALAGESAAEKRNRLGAALRDAGERAAVLTLPDSIAWLLNIRGSDLNRSPVAQGFAVLHADARVEWFLDPDKVSGDVLTHLGNGVTISPPAAFGDAIAALDGPVRLDRTSCPLWIADRLAEGAGTPVWGQDPCILPKARKNATELAGMRAAHLRDGAAMVRLLHWLDMAMISGATLTEIDIVERLEEIRCEDPALEDISFDTICGSGPNGAIVHYRVTRDSNRTVLPGDLILIDSGGQYTDGTTDITRTVATGPVTNDQRQQFTRVLKGMIAISMARWPEGLAGRDLDALARIALWQSGHDYDHGTGHGVGAFLNVHEGPQSLSRRSTVPLEPGMILSNEPGYYRAGAWGIRIENLVSVTAPGVPEGGERPMLGFETLTFCPIDRRLIDRTLLSADEAAWLDAYHSEVRERLLPVVPEGCSDWLTAATAPLASGDGGSAG